MDDFVHRQNLRHLRTVLEQTTDEAKRRQIMKLLAEEEAADKNIVSDRNHLRTTASRKQYRSLALSDAAN